MSQLGDETRMNKCRNGPRVSRPAVCDGELDNQSENNMNANHTISLRLAQCPLGRVLLHLGCAISRPDHLAWHWRGIQRDLRLAAERAVRYIAICTKSSLAA